jgi:spore germination protein YaaH
MQKLLHFLLNAALLSALLFSASAHAATGDLEVSGWLPYWRDTEATRAARNHLDALSVIHPFGYGVKSDGALSDLMDIDERSWERLFSAARRDDVAIVPTVMWSDAAAMHLILSDPRRRAAHIRAIARTVRRERFDGIDIDYEAKFAATKDAFSLFLKELKDALDEKMLFCTIEARTPPDSLYRTIPATLEYANDYAAIARYCDRVNIMAYDQRRADLALNDARKGAPYIPVADADWVRKVVALAVESIPKEKIVLGVATYGHEYEVLVTPNSFNDYRRVSAHNIPAASAIAKRHDIKPARGSSGEVGFSFVSGASAEKLKPLLSSLGRSARSTPDIAAKSALAYANVTGQMLTVGFVTWSDADAIQEKAEIAEEFGLRGIALFKIDGQEDPDVWDLFER